MEHHPPLAPYTFASSPASPGHCRRVRPQSCVRPQVLVRTPRGLLSFLQKCAPRANLLPDTILRGASARIVEELQEDGPEDGDEPLEGPVIPRPADYQQLDTRSAYAPHQGTRAPACDPTAGWPQFAAASEFPPAVAPNPYTAQQHMGDVAAAVFGTSSSPGPAFGSASAASGPVFGAAPFGPAISGAPGPTFGSAQSSFGPAFNASGSSSFAAPFGSAPSAAFGSAPSQQLSPHPFSSGTASGGLPLAYDPGRWSQLAPAELALWEVEMERIFGKVIDHGGPASARDAVEYQVLMDINRINLTPGLSAEQKQTVVSKRIVQRLEFLRRKRLAEAIADPDQRNVQLQAAKDWDKTLRAPQQVSSEWWQADQAVLARTGLASVAAAAAAGAKRARDPNPAPRPNPKPKRNPKNPKGAPLKVPRQPGS
eukprot:NODE_208_length_2469_cov_7.645041_g161_i0.p1 GENE.NODE_208_length_2469_cov_7.645041_g161_i0~~NODE_208_length_2469_cov_7.645041_g161_i0.p1  ORF type:complete len:426 (+),score=34.21 NODE_208_length_2469_cov_7.645041_g161_i0:22-1299(+)